MSRRSPKLLGMSLQSPFWLCPFVSLVVGCAGLPLPKAPTQDIAETRRVRADAATQHFASGRDFAQLQNAAARWTQGDAAGCEGELQRLLARNPEHRDARLFLANVCIADGRRQEALEHVRAVLDADPEDAQAIRIMDRVRDLADETDDASVRAASFTRPTAGVESGNERRTSSDQTASSAESDAVASAGVSGSDDPQISISAATAALRANRPGRAVEILTTTLRQFPNSAAGYRILGVAHYRLGDYESSQVAIQQALSLDNSAAMTYFLLGCAQAKLGQPESAEANFRQARAIDPTYAMRR